MIDYAGPYPVPNKTLHEWVMEGDRWVRFFLPLSLDVLISVDGIDGMNELALEVIGYDGIGELCYGIQGLATDERGKVLIVCMEGALDLDDMKETFLVDPGPERSIDV